jgi:hypothetical protein
VIPGSRFIARNVLEWRCDAPSPWREAAVTDARAQVIVICNEEYQTSLAASGSASTARLTSSVAFRPGGQPVKRSDRADLGNVLRD